MKRPAAAIETSGHPVQWEKEPEPVVNEKWFEGMMDMVKDGRTKANTKLKAGPTTQRKGSGRNIVNSLLMKITKKGEGSWPETFAKKNLIKDGFQEKTNRTKAWNQRMWTDQFPEYIKAISYKHILIYYNIINKYSALIIYFLFVSVE